MKLRLVNFINAAATPPRRGGECPPAPHFRQFVLVIVLLAGLSVPGFAQTQNDFFNDQVLHEIRIDIRPSDWEKLKQDFLENTYFPCDFRWRFNGRDIRLEGIGIRSRGTGSRSGVKPGLRVDFDRYETTQSFVGLKSFILRNNTQDSSMMHEFIGMGLLRRMGLPAPREAFAKFYVNDEYAGLYTIVESVDKAFLKRLFNDDTGYLYKYDFAADDPPYLFEDRGVNGGLYVPKPFKPETHEDSPNSIAIAMMVQAMNQAPDAMFAAATGVYIDLKAFLMEVAVEQFLAEQDGILGDFGMNNYYMYQFGNSNRFHFIPWDKSNTFESVNRSVWMNSSSNVLMRRTLDAEGMQAVFVDALLRTAASSGAAGGWMDQEITRASNLIRDAVYQDPVKLCDPGHTGGLRPCTNAEFEAEVLLMSQFAQQRGEAVMSEIQSVTGANYRLSYSISDRGGSSTMTRGASGATPVVGYARIQPNTGNFAPAGLAIFSLRQGGVLVTEAAVPAARLTQNARIYAEVNGPVNTGLAIANPNARAATIAFYFTDAAGNNSPQRTTTIAANGQIAAFLNEAPFSGGAAVSGSFTFSSSVPVAVVALRGFTNERSEFLITTLPVVELTNAAAPASTLPHFADGGGWTTQVVLINSSDQSIAGTVQFAGPGSATAAAQPVNVSIDGRTDSSFSYTIPARSSIRLRTSGAGAAIQTGSVRIVTTDRLPEALAIFSFKKDGVTVSEAGVPAIPSGPAFRMYVESGEGGAVQSGIAVVNFSNTPAVVNFELGTLAGESTGLTGVITVPANGQSAMFLNQVQGFATLPASFKGVLRASTSSTAGISMIGLRGRYNERGDFLITTTSPVLESSNPPSGELLFPHFVDSGGYTTQFILFSGYAGQSPSGTVRYFSQAGLPMDVRIQ
ncbi:MAG: CotH kinase family protein [Acidobacteria bacterium]|nr:CotH kinase family protein [Acidobacteriota bacterium]